MTWWLDKSIIADQSRPVRGGWGIGTSSLSHEQWLGTSAWKVRAPGTCGPTQYTLSSWHLAPINIQLVNKWVDLTVSQDIKYPQDGTQCPTSPSPSLISSHSPTHVPQATATLVPQTQPTTSHMHPGSLCWALPPLHLCLLPSSPGTSH